MDTNNNSPSLQTEEIAPDIRAMIMEIHDYITELKHDYDKYIADVQLDRRTLEMLLDVSEATIGRWRSSGVLPYTVSSSRISYYRFEDVFVAVKRGQLKARTFDPVEALKRLKAFQNGLLFQVKTSTNSEES
ncbi:MAG: DNA-binding protein [Paramuribaculum sp.]|nr:DNA-binding protein [Paramuribaculum sp.]